MIKAAKSIKVNFQPWNELGMSRSVRWGSLRPPGTDLPWYYSPNSHSTSQSIYKPSTESAAAKQAKPLNADLVPSIDGGKESDSQPKLAVSRRTWRYMATTAPSVVAERPKTSLGIAPGLSPMRPESAPRLRVDDLISREPVQKSSDATTSLGPPGTANSGKKTAFVSAVQVNTFDARPAGSPCHKKEPESPLPSI